MVVHAFQPHIKAPQPADVLEHFVGAIGFQRPAVVLGVAQGQAAVAAHVHRPHLDIRLARAQVVLLGQRLPHLAIAAFVVNRRHIEFVFAVVVAHGKQAEVAHQLGRQVLRDKALVLEVAHGKVQRRQPGPAGNIRKPFAVFGGGRLADAADVLIHGKAQCIGVDAGVPAAGHGRLVHHIGVRLQKLHHEAVGAQAFFV